MARIAPPGEPCSVEPRDVHAAALSYDGREPAQVVRSLVTQPVPGTSPPELEPVLYPIPGPAHIERCYLEMVQPNDCAADRR